MESVLALVNDKKSFLQGFVQGQFEACPLVIGMVFSFCQKDLKEELSLFLALERLVNETRDELQIFYCVFKMLKSGQDYLKAKFNRLEFVSIYCKVVSLLTNLKVPRHLESRINYMFTENWQSLANTFAYSEAFVEIYWLGKRFDTFFTKLPLILHPDLEKEMNQLVEFSSAQINKEFLLSLNGVMRFMKYDQAPDECANLASFMNFVVVFVYKNNENLEVLYELKKKVEEHFIVFSEQSRIEMDLEFKAAVKRQSGETRDPMNAEILNRGKMNNFVEPRNQVPFYRSANAMIKIPQKGYENPAPSPPAGCKPDPKVVKNEFYGNNQRDPYNMRPEPFKNNPVAFRPNLKHPEPHHPNPVQKDHFLNRVDSAPSEINVDNKKNEEFILDLLEGLKGQFKVSQSVESNEVQTILRSCEKASVTFAKDLKKVLKDQVERNLNSDDFEFWDNIIDACKVILPNEEIADISRACEERNKRMNSEVFLSRGQGSNRLRRPGSRRGSGGESRNLIGEYREEHKNLRRGQDVNEDSIEWSYESQNQSFNKEEPLFGDQALPVNYRASAPEKQKDSIVEVDSAKLQVVDYIQLLNTQAQDVIKIIRSDTAEAINLNDVLISIKTEIKQKSPSCTFTLIGSAYLGSHIKNTPVDACFVDYLNPEPQALLKSVIQKLGYELTFEIDLFVIFKSKENEYRVYINYENYHNTTLLLKEYCSFGTLFQDLVILLKYWAISNGLFSNYLSGYHLNLICLNYLQCFDPPILPKLQQDVEHNPGHWYKKNSGFRSTSSASIGDVFYHLFSTLITISQGYLCDPTQGAFTPYETISLFSCFNLNDRNEVSNLPLQDSRSQKYLELLHQTFSDISNQKDLYKIMRLK